MTCGLGSITSIDDALRDIQPGETRTLAKTQGYDGSGNRWFRVIENHEATPKHEAVPPGLFLWQNRPELQARPQAPHHFGGYRGIESIERPIIEFKGNLSQLQDYYHGLDDFFASPQLLDAILRLDANAVEYVAIDVHVEGNCEQYYYCLCTRSLKAIDEARTTTIVRPGLVYFDQDLFVVAPGVAVDVHCFSLFHVSYRLWSVELVEAIVASGARGMRFWPPFESPWSTNTIRI